MPQVMYAEFHFAAPFSWYTFFHSILSKYKSYVIHNSDKNKMIYVLFTIWITNIPREMRK